MRSVLRIWSGWALGLGAVLMLVPVSLGQSQDLQAALKLFDDQDYVAAQEALLKIDRDKLTDAERVRLDELLKVVPEAIQGNEKARQALVDGDVAYDAGAWDAADGHYQAVLDNQYAPAAGRQHATEQRARIVEKKKLAEAAKPAGAVEETSITITTEETPAPKAATQPSGKPATEGMVKTEGTPEQGPHRLTPTEQLRMQDELRWQRAVAQAQSLESRAHEAMAASNFVQARELADSALHALFQFPPDMAPLPMPPNQLNSQVLVRAYENDWKDISH